MLQIEPTVLIRKLNRYCTSALEAGAGVAVSRGHYEITVEHLLSQLCQDPAADMQVILLQFGVDPGRVLKALTRSLESQRSGNTGRPVFSPHMLSWMQDAWLMSSAEQGWTVLRSGALLSALLISPHTYTSGPFIDQFEPVAKEELRKKLASFVEGSIEDDQMPSVGGASSGGATSSEQAGPPRPRAGHRPGPLHPGLHRRGPRGERRSDHRSRGRDPAVHRHPGPAAQEQPDHRG